MNAPQLPIATVRTTNGGISTGFYVGPDPIHDVHVFVVETVRPGTFMPLLVEFDRTLSLNLHPDGETYAEYLAGYRCAGVGVGYWECDVPGGCDGCVHLAWNIGDSEQLAEWRAQRPGTRRD